MSGMHGHACGTPWQRLLGYWPVGAAPWPRGPAQTELPPTRQAVQNTLPQDAELQVEGLLTSKQRNLILVHCGQCRWPC